MNIYGFIDGHKSGLSIKYYILLRSSCASPTPKGVYLWTFKKNNL